MFCRPSLSEFQPVGEPPSDKNAPGGATCPFIRDCERTVEPPGVGRNRTAPFGPLFVSAQLVIAGNVTTRTNLTLAPANPWSGLDAGRREQVALASASLRYFRRSRRLLKTGSAPILHSVELRGDAERLRALRSAEMKAWEQSGGDFYRPVRTVA